MRCPIQVLTRVTPRAGVTELRTTFLTQIVLQSTLYNKQTYETTRKSEFRNTYKRTNERTNVNLPASKQACIYLLWSCMDS